MSSNNRHASYVLDQRKQALCFTSMADIDVDGTNHCNPERIFVDKCHTVRVILVLQELWLADDVVLELDTSSTTQ